MRRNAGVWITVNPNKHEELINIVKDEATNVGSTGDLLQIDLYTDSQSFQVLMDTIKREGLKYSYSEGREYTKEEISQATYFDVELRNLLEKDSRKLEEYGTQYEDVGCAGCGLGRIPLNNLIIDKKKLGKYHIATLKPELIVSEQFRTIVIENGLTGCEFSEVKDYKNRDLPNFYRLICTSILPAMNAIEINIEYSNTHKCNVCGDVGKILRSEAVYDLAALEHAYDFNLSLEYFGLASHRARRLIVSAKVRNIMTKQKIQMAFEPVRLV